MEQSWKTALSAEFEKAYFLKLSAFVKDEILAGKIIYPHPKNIFAALDNTPFEKVKVVILWQDPYHGPGQAHGLAFSVQEWVRNPPSLQNIFKEIESEIASGILPPCQGGMPARQGGLRSGDLTNWSEQWVLLLNTTLTVRAGEPMSHAGQWWETFTDAVIQTLSDKRDFLIFLLWWSHAQKKKSLIDTSKHVILEAPHPSPLSAHRGFLGCGHFSKTNALLKEHWISEISW